MGRELNLRQHRFIAEYMKHGIASRAYMAAGYIASTRNALDVSACKLLRSSKIRSVIEARKRQMLKRSDITLEKLLSDAEDARQLAMRIDQPSAAKGAGEFQAKLVGLLVERKETGAPGEFSGLNTPEEVIAAIRLELGEDAANALQALLNKPLPPPPSPPLDTPAEAAPTPTTRGSGSLN